MLSRYSDSLRVGPSGDRIPVGARFSTPFQTGHGAHPASYTIGTGFFPRVLRPGHGVDHPPPSSAEVKEIVELYLYSPSGPSWHLNRGSTVVKVLCYKSEGRWFDPSWCPWNFSLTYNPSDHTMALGSAKPLTEMSTRSISWG